MNRGESTMKRIEPGSIVKLCYKSKLEEADAFSSNKECQQVEVQVGSGKVMEGFETAIIGMLPKEKKTFTLSPNEAYGERDERLERIFRRSELPTDFRVKAGEMIALQTSEGDQLLATIKDAEGEEIILDFNHPLAGKSLTFEVEIEEVQ